MAELRGSDIIGIRFWNIPGGDSAMISYVLCMVYNTFLFCRQAGLVVRFYSQFIKTRGKKSITEVFQSARLELFCLFLLTNGFQSLVLFQGEVLIFEFSCKEGSYLCLGLWEMLNNVYLPPTPLMAQGFSSKTVPSFGNTTEALFESILFHTHISIVSRVV